MCFKKRGDRKKEVKESEREKEGRQSRFRNFRYLRYILKKNGEDEGQVRDLKKKGNIVMRRETGVWRNKDLETILEEE